MIQVKFSNYSFSQNQFCAQKFTLGFGAMKSAKELFELFATEDKNYLNKKD
jgi:hypothetical protein